MIIKPKTEPKVGFVPTQNYNWNFGNYNIYPLFKDDGKEVFYAVHQRNESPSSIEICYPNDKDNGHTYLYNEDRTREEYDSPLAQKAVDIIRQYEHLLVALTGEEVYDY